MFLSFMGSIIVYDKGKIDSFTHRLGFKLWCIPEHI